MRKYLKRVVFVVILIFIASFIYYLFNPIEWQKLFTNTKNIPNYIAYFFWGEEVETVEIIETAQNFQYLHQFIVQWLETQELIGIDSEIVAQLAQIQEILKSEDIADLTDDNTDFSDVLDENEKEKEETNLVDDIESQYLSRVETSRVQELFNLIAE